MRVTSVKKRRRRFGAVTVELAAILPLFVTLILGQIEMSRLGMVSQILTNAARQGCRVAVLNGKALSDVQSAVTAALAASGVSPGNISLVASDPGSAGAYLMPSTLSATEPTNGTPITLTLRVTYSSVSWFPTPQFLGNAKISGSATMNSERP